jgi:TolB protein
MAADGTEQLNLTTDGGRPSWSPDGAYIAFVESGQIYVIDRHGFDRMQITDVDLLAPDKSVLEFIPEGFYAIVSRPIWSPIGDLIAFVVKPPGYYLHAPQTSTVHVIAPNGSERMSWKADTPSWSPDGSQIVSTTPYGRMFVTNLDRSPLEKLELSAGGKGEEPIWEPEGTRIAYLKRQKRGEGAGIYVIEADGTSSRHVVDVNDGVWQGISWLPGGKRISFVSSRIGADAIYVINADGSGMQLLSHIPRGGFNPTWLPGGTQIGFLAPCPRLTNTQVILQDIQGALLNELSELSEISSTAIGLLLVVVVGAVVVTVRYRKRLSRWPFLLLILSECLASILLAISFLGLLIAESLRLAFGGV